MGVFLASTGAFFREYRRYRRNAWQRVHRSAGSCGHGRKREPVRRGWSGANRQLPVRQDPSATLTEGRNRPLSIRARDGVLHTTHMAPKNLFGRRRQESAIRHPTTIIHQSPNNHATGQQDSPIRKQLDHTIRRLA